MASGKGGVGTSTVAGLLSVVASQEGSSVLLIDGDVQFGVQHLLFAVPANRGLAALRSGNVDPLGLPVPVTEGLMILCGGPGGEGPPPVGVELKATFRRVSPLVRAFGARVVDAGSQHATVEAALGCGAANLVAVCQPDRISVAATYALIKQVWKRHAELLVQVIVNEATPAQAQVAFQAIATACDRFLGRRARFAGAIPEDATLHDRLAEGIGLHDPDAAGPAHEAAGLVVRRIRSVGVPAAIGHHATRRV